MQPAKIKAFIIHLHRATDRRDQVARLQAELLVASEIIQATDARNLTQADIDRVYRPKIHQPAYPFRLSHNEIACFLSHRQSWQAIVDQGLDAGLVLEDDVALTRDFAAAFAAASTQFATAGLVRLPFRSDRESGATVYSNQGVKIIRPVPVGLGMVAQLISRDAAQILLEKTRQFDRPVDTFAQMNWITGLSPLSVVPGGVSEISASLGGSTLRQRRTIFDKIHREIMRPIYRRSVVRYAHKFERQNLTGKMP